MSSSTDSPIKRVAYIAVAIGLVALVSASTAKLIRSTLGRTRRDNPGRS